MTVSVLQIICSASRKTTCKFHEPLTNHRHLLNDRLMSSTGEAFSSCGKTQTHRNQKVYFRNTASPNEVILEFALICIAGTDPERASVQYARTFERQASVPYLFSTKGEERFLNTLW